MNDRDEEASMNSAGKSVRTFVDAAQAAFTAHAADEPSRRMLAATFAAASGAPAAEVRLGARLPGCSCLEEALTLEVGSDPLGDLVAAFRAVEPFVTWRRRPDPEGTSRGAYEAGHANAIVVGPGGVWDRPDIYLGATLMAPNIRYPDHDHAPEEVYLVLAPGEFLQGGGDWFPVGTGGSFYNPPGIRHSMRSLDRPFLTFWALTSIPSANPVDDMVDDRSLGE